MFTIKGIKNLGKSGVRWESREAQSAIDSLNRDTKVADLLKQAEIAHEEIQKFQNEPQPDVIKINNAIGRFGEILKKIDAKNIKDRQAVLTLITDAINKAPNSSDSKKGLEALKAGFDVEYKILDEKNAENKDETKSGIKKETSRTIESVVQKNSREIQARDFTDYVASKLSEPARGNFLDAVTKKDEAGKVTYLLTNVSVPNLLRSIDEGTVYIADGAQWNDRFALGKFLEVYKNNKSAFDPILKPLTIAASAGQSVESVRKSGSLPSDTTDNATIIQYLAKIDNFETHGTTALDRQLSAATTILLEKVQGNDIRFLGVLQNAAILGGYPLSQRNDLNGGMNIIKNNPTLKYYILAGIRQAARMPGGIDSLLDSKKASGIGENEQKMLIALNENKVNLLDGLKDGFQKQLEKQIKDGTITGDKKNEAQEAIDAYIAEMKKEGSAGWNIVSKSLGAAITNRGAGVAAGATVNFPPNWLADNVSLGIGFSSGKPGVGVGVTFDRSLTQDTKLLYGWAGSPFVGMTSQFDKWHFTGIAGVGGGLLNVSRDMGNKDLEVKNMEKMKSAEGILNQIDALSRNVSGHRTSYTIEFSSDYSKYPDNSKDPMEPTKARVGALDRAINADVQNRLALAGFDTESNPVIRAQMIHNALSQAVQSRIDRLHLDDATGGLSLKSLGLTLGSFAGIPFILPSISFGRTSYVQSLKLSKTEENTGENTEGKAAIPGKDKIKESDISLEKLDLDSVVRSELSNKEVRKSLSYIWKNATRSQEANSFSDTLQRIQSGDSTATIEDAKQSFLKMVKGLGLFVKLRTVVDQKNIDPKKLQGALFDIRGAMMMDANQAVLVSTKKSNIDVAEKSTDTEKRFKEMLGKTFGKDGVLSQTGLTSTDFDDILKSGNGSITIGTPKENTFGAVASLKTIDKYMALMPVGTMRFASRGGQEFSRDVSNLGTDKKRGMLKIALPEDGITDTALRASVSNILKGNAEIGPKVTHEQLVELLAKGTTKIEGRDVNMTGQKFLLCAYGDCTNPGIAITPGKISAPAITGVPAVPPSIPASDGGYNVTMNSRSNILGFTGAIGWVGDASKNDAPPSNKPKDPPPTEKPPEQPPPTEKPPEQPPPVVIPPPPPPEVVNPGTTTIDSGGGTGGTGDGGTTTGGGGDRRGSATTTKP